MSIRGRALSFLAIGANLLGVPLPNPTGRPGPIPYPIPGGGQQAGPHTGGRHIGGGPMAIAGGQWRGPHRKWLITESTTLKGRAITPVTSLKAPTAIIARGFGSHRGGGQGGGPQNGGAHTGGPHIGGAHIGGGQIGPPAET